LLRCDFVQRNTRELLGFDGVKVTCRRDRFQGWGRGPVGWTHGQSFFFFRFVALGQVKRPPRRRPAFGEVRSGKGQSEGRIQGRICLWFGRAQFGSAIESIEFREFWPPHLGREAVTWWKQRFRLEFAAIFEWIAFGSNGYRPPESTFRQF